MRVSVEGQNQRYYDTEAKVYDSNRYASLKGQRVEKFHKLILDSFLVSNLAKGARVLEVGCGTGRLLAELAWHDYRLHGIDASEGMLAIARERFTAAKAAVELEMADATRMRFNDASFDAAYSILVVNLIPNYRRMFQEVARILKPGGLFVFNVPNLMSVYALGGLYVNMRGRTVGSNSAGHRHSHWFLPREWQTGLSDSGFSIEEVLGQPPHLRIVDGASPLRARGLPLLLSKSVYVKARRKHI